MDLDVFRAIGNERIRQKGHVKLIASENFVSQAVMESIGSVLMDKYAEGHHKKDIMVADKMYRSRKETICRRVCKCTASFR